MNGPIDDQDDAWLVYADWLEDHGDPRAAQIRDEVACERKAWEYEYRGGVVGVGGGVVGGGGVGGS